jgi:predicted transcriptional regulator
MALISHTPDDRRAALYGRPCQEKDIDPRGRITLGAHWFGTSTLTDACTPPIRSYRHNTGTVYHKKSVIEIATGRIFDSLTDAAAYLGISQSAMSQKVKTGKGYVFAEPNNTGARKIRNLITKEIYSSVDEATLKSGIGIDQIRRHCQNRIANKKFEYVERESNAD